MLAACLLAGSSFAQGDQDSGLNNFGTGFILNITELPRADTSLQMLIDIVHDGSTVKLLPDTYALSQPLSINKNITLVGSPFVQIDGCGTSQILNIDNPNANVTLENILFTHGNGSDGGAIASQAGSLTIKNCWVLDNMAINGSGVYQKGGDLKIVNSTFMANKVRNMGVAVCAKGGDVHLENSTFDHNFGSQIIEIEGDQPYQANVLIKGCSVSNNERLIAGYEVYEAYCEASEALACLNTNTLIDQCVFNNNTLAGDGSKACGLTYVLYFESSKVTLNDTRVERNEGVLMGGMGIYGCYGSGGSIVQMNRCNITENHARCLLDCGCVFCAEDKGSVYDECRRFNDAAGVEIDGKSDVNMSDVIIEGNIVDQGECGAIKNAGKLNLNKGTVITKNSARQYSALFNTNTGVVNISKDVVIIDNHDDLQPSQPIHNDGILNQDVG